MLVGGDLEEDAVANELHAARHPARRDRLNGPLHCREVLFRKDPPRHRLCRLGERGHEAMKRLRALHVAASRVSLQKRLKL